MMGFQRALHIKLTNLGETLDDNGKRNTNYSVLTRFAADNLKFPGQVTDIVNAIPDVTNGLFKRPGAKGLEPTHLPMYKAVGLGFITFVTRQRIL